MSGTDTEALAETFAAQGREELLSRFREAYAKALGAHADLVSFDSARIEAMVQRSAADADGLQWRRALAGVAARELEIELGLALTHPAVVRAHQLVGAPSYESALAALAVPAPLPEPPPAPVLNVPEERPAVAEAPAAAAPAAAEVVVEPAVEPAAPAETELGVEDAEPALFGELESETGPELESGAGPEAAAEAGPEAAPEPEAVGSEAEAGPVVDQPTVAYDALAALAEDADTAPAGGHDEAEDEDEDFEEPSDEVLAHRAADFAEEFMAQDEDVEDALPDADEFTYEHDALPEAVVNGDVAEFSAVHIGGVATLPSSQEIAVRISEEGLDLMQEDGSIVGRLGWSDIAALEVTVPHGRRRRRGSPRLVVHTAGGSARFEVPSLSGEELQEQVQPLMNRYGH